MDYKNWQEYYIKKYNIQIVENSTCWNRTHAHCDGTRRICKWKSTNSYLSLFSLLHEIGHIETDKSTMKRAEQESEATRWAVNELRHQGIPIKQKILKRYKDYTIRTYNRGIRRGLQKRIKSKLYI
jgi:hypothetical protein